MEAGFRLGLRDALHLESSILVGLGLRLVRVKRSRVQVGFEVHSALP